MSNGYRTLLILLLSLVFGWSSQSYADSPAMPVPQVTPAEWGNYYFVMIPKKAHFKGSKYIVDKPAFGIVYQLKHDGTSVEMWRVKDWYAFKVFLSYNAEYLVRMGPWSQGSEPADDDLAVAFYKNGKLLKQYSTNDLIKNKKSVQISISHYQWLAEGKDAMELWYDNKFYLKTIEGMEYTFDVTTGDIIKH